MADLDLHNAIMNIPCHPYRDGEEFVIGYKFGHRDARHAAAELALASPPVAVQEEGDAKDGARYREFFASGLPITFLGVEYRTKAELDAAIDAVKGDQP